MNSPGFTSRRLDGRALYLSALAVCDAWAVRSVEVLCWGWLCAWAGALAFNVNFFHAYSSGATSSMLRHMSQPVWATLLTLVAGYEAIGLERRRRNSPDHRRTRRWTTATMTIMSGMLAGELAAGDGAVPSVYGFALNAFFCLMSFTRLCLLPDEDESRRDD